MKNKYFLAVLFILWTFLHSCKKDDPNARLYSFNEGKLYGYLNEKGEVVVPPTYDKTYDFSEGMGRVMQGEKYGYVNDKGELVIPITYGYAMDFSCGVARVNEGYSNQSYESQTSGWKYINKKGVSCPNTYRYTRDFKNGFGAVQYAEGSWAVMKYDDGEFKEMSPPYTLDDVSDFSEEGLCSFRYGGFSGVFDKSMNVLIEPNRFLSITEYSEGFASAFDQATRGFINSKGEWIYSYPNTDSYNALYLGFFKNGYAWIEKEKNKWTFLDKSGKMPFNQTWSSIGAFSKEGFGKVSIPDRDYYQKWGVINTKGEYVIKPQYREIDFYDKGLMIFKDSLGKGVMNLLEKKIIIPASDYDEITIMGERIKVRKSGDKWGFINERGEFVIQPEYEYAGNFENGTAYVSKGSFVSYINKKGEKVANKNAESASTDAFVEYLGDNKEVLKSYSTQQQLTSTSYDKIVESQSNAGVFLVNLGATKDVPVTNGGKWGMVDAKGQTLLNCSKEIIYDFVQGIAIFNEGGSCSMEEYYGEYEGSGTYYYFNCTGGVFGILENTGKILVPAQYNSLIIINPNVIIAEKEGKFGVIDSKSKEVVPFEYESIQHISYFNGSKVLKIKQNGMFGFLDEKGAPIISPKFEDIEIVTDKGLDILKAKQNGLWGIFNVKADSFALKNTYNNIGLFSEGYCSINLNEKYGFIDENLQVIIEPKFTWVREFSEGYAPVKLVNENNKNAYAIIDKSGEYIIKPFESDYEVYFGNFVGGLNTMSSYGSEGSSEYGLFNDKGKILIPLGGSTEIRVQPKGIAYVKNNDKWAIVNKEGALLTGYEFAHIDDFGDGQTVTRAAKGNSTGYEEMGEVYVENGIWGGLNVQGKEVIPFKYSYLNPFKEGLASARAAENPDKIGYTDLTGNWIVPIK